MLSFSEYQELGGRLTDEVIYTKLEHDAVQLLNTATQMFYVRNDISTDQDEWRVKMFKMALVAQIDYTNDVGASTEYEMAQKLLRVCLLMELLLQLTEHSKIVALAGSIILL